VAAEKDEEPGVLGNLPRSRPGHRSDKRGGTGGAASTGAPKRQARATTARTARSAPAPGADRERARQPEAGAHRSGDPLSVAVHLAGRVAEAGLKTAGGLLRRLPGR
jgi:hypothetical protein